MLGDEHRLSSVQRIAAVLVGYRHGVLDPRSRWLRAKQELVIVKLELKIADQI
jgi:hypothetical protein